MSSRDSRYVRPESVLVPILLLHGFRHLGLMFLAPGGTYAGMPPQFAYPAAFGDLLAAVLALAAIPGVRRSARGGRLLVWIFNVEGSVDLIAAITLANIYGAAPYMGPAYWIPAFWVPALLVTHYITFVVLLKYWTGAAHAALSGCSFTSKLRRRRPEACRFPNGVRTDRQFVLGANRTRC